MNIANRVLLLGSASLSALALPIAARAQSVEQPAASVDNANKAQVKVSPFAGPVDDSAPAATASESGWSDLLTSAVAFAPDAADDWKRIAAFGVRALSVPPVASNVASVNIQLALPKIAPTPLIISGGPNGNATPGDFLDTANINGIGQMVTFFSDGAGSSCTATLISPRTVIFAAHCVASDETEKKWVDPSIYGAGHGGQPISFSFQSSNRDAVRQWAGVTGDGSMKFKTDTSLAIYNSNYVTYDLDTKSLSLPGSPETVNGLAGQADLALAALDTPAADIPTWTLLFSPLTGPTHVTITGYGLHGTALTGADVAASIDYRRRSAESVVAAYMSPATVELGIPIAPGISDTAPFLTALAGAGTSAINAYWISFTDPNWNTANAATAFGLPLDDNVFNQSSVPQLQGSPAQGDSGGPLIVDQLYDKPVVAGVTSAGLPTGLGAEIATLLGAASGVGPFTYGWSSYYQPLFNYWNWIVANDPYKYVGAKAGDGKWTDPTHWQLNLNPNFVTVDASGKLVNALPTSLPAGITPANGEWGTLCSGILGGACVDTAQVEKAGQLIDTSTNPNGVLNGVVPRVGGVTVDPVPFITNSSTAAGTGTIGTSGSPSGAAGNAAGGAGGTSTTSATVAADVPASIAANKASLVNIVDGGPVRVSLADLGATGTPQSVDAATVATAVSASPPSLTPVPAAAADAVAPADALPAPTLQNGLPGATNFVPIDDDGAVNRAPLYFDVTLSAAGKTTLDTNVTIDRFTLSGVNSALDITSSGTLSTYIDTTVTAGMLNVDGRLNSVGDFALLGGILTGSGTINAPYFTSALGLISPGKLGATAKLTIEGTVILASGNILAIDLGPNGTSDLLAVKNNAIAGTAGDINLGGILGLGAAAGYRPTYNDHFNFITADGQVTGTFDMVTPLPGVLRPLVTYGDHLVELTIDAASYTTETNPNSSNQMAYTTLLDQNRVNYAALPTLYGDLDVLGAADVQRVLEQAAPYVFRTRQSLVQMQVGALADLHRDRLWHARTGDTAGELTLIGRPLQFAQLALQPGPGAAPIRDDSAPIAEAAPGVKLPDNMSGYLSVAYLSGSAAGLNSLITTGRSEKLDGWYISGGVEVSQSNGFAWGGSLSYSESHGDAIAGKVDNHYLEAALYGFYRSKAGLRASVVGTIGSLNTQTQRTAYATAGSYQLSSIGNAPVYSIEGSLGYEIGKKSIKLVPTLGLRDDLVDFGTTRENGGDFALRVDARKYALLQGRAGLSLEGSSRRSSDGLTVSPHLDATFVHAFDQQGDPILANFAGGTGPSAVFVGAAPDRNWAEVSGGLTISSRHVSFDLRAMTMIGRQNLEYQSYRLSAKFKF